MNSIQRTKAPEFRTIDHVEVLQARRDELDNGIPFFSISAGSQEISKIEFLFRAGMYYQPSVLIASCTNALLESGTRSYDANAFSEGLDFYGSYLELEVDQDYASVTLYSLNKYLPESLHYIEELLKYPQFPAEEFRIHLSNKKQKHIINSQKVSVLARRKFAELLYGPSHPYGVMVQDSDFDKLELSELKNFFAQRYGYRDCCIVASGKLSPDLKNVLNTKFGTDKWGEGTRLASVSHTFEKPQARKTFVARKEAIQSAIRIGRLLFNKTHPDYFKFQVLNTILGGYFGSRLMANIREDKGYTYGIGSGLSNYVHAGAFFISTEVGTDVTEKALQEIYREIKRLREDLVDAQEVETVRNYMLGNFLRSVDGPFALADKFKAIWEFGLDYTYYDRYFKAVKEVNPAELRELANKYLQVDQLLECVVGKTD
ncbi:MAG TPA: pitrilysin family protein [Bacteroidia bacterium]|nr:pitrilysin family protein [Bacteroidia bacterium]